MLTRRRFLTLGGAVLGAVAGGEALRSRLVAGDRAMAAFDEATGAHALPAAVPGGAPCQPASPHDPALSRPLRVALLSDSHVMPAASAFARTINVKLGQALQDLGQDPPDLWLFDGDLTEHGYPAEFGAFKEILGPDRLSRSLLVTGNHEFFDPDVTDRQALDRFQAAFALPRPYSSHVAGGVHFVMLADEQYKSAPRNSDWAWLTPDQVTWFEQVLAEHRHQFTVVCMHQPLQETVTGSEGGNAFAGTGQIGALRSILKRNPQVRLWFSGHTHSRLEEQKQIVQHGPTLFLGLGSTCYQYVPAEAPTAQADTPDGFRKDREASQSRLMEIWPDRVLVRTRDHTARAWLDHLEIAVRRA